MSVDKSEPPVEEDDDDFSPMRECEKHCSASLHTSENKADEQVSPSGRQQSNSKPPSQKLASFSGVLMLAIIIVATYFYIENGKPLIQLPPDSKALTGYFQVLDKLIP